MRCTPLLGVSWRRGAAGRPRYDALLSRAPANPDPPQTRRPCRPQPLLPRLSKAAGAHLRCSKAVPRLCHREARRGVQGVLCLAGSGVQLLAAPDALKATGLQLTRKPSAAPASPPPLTSTTEPLYIHIYTDNGV